MIDERTLELLVTFCKYQVIKLLVLDKGIPLIIIKVIVIQIQRLIFSTQFHSCAITQRYLDFLLFVIPAVHLLAWWNKSPVDFLQPLFFSILCCLERPMDMIFHCCYFGSLCLRLHRCKEFRERQRCMATSDNRCINNF